MKSTEHLGPMIQLLGRIDDRAREMQEAARKDAIIRKTSEALEHRVNTLHSIFWEALRKYDRDNVFLNIDCLPELDATRMKYKVTVVNKGEKPFGPNLVETIRSVTDSSGFNHQRIVCVYSESLLTFYFYDRIVDIYDLAILAD